MNGQYSVGDYVFGNWRLERLIGEGSYGKVYEAVREDFGNTYRSAIKIMTIPQNQSEVTAARAEMGDESSVTEYFSSIAKDVLHEYSIMSKIKGVSNIVSCEDYAIIEHENQIGWDIIIRMELLTPLMEYTQHYQFGEADVIHLGIDLCRALEVCQKYNIIHRDIKPENIFVSEMGNFKLGDFGVSRTIEKTMGNLSKKGTYNYMAPEVYYEKSYGSSVDIYSLGIVLYWYLNNNRVPFLPDYPSQVKYSDRVQALEKRMKGTPIPSPKNGSKELKRIVLKACAYDPKDRFSSPAEMRKELEHIADMGNIDLDDTIEDNSGTIEDNDKYYCLRCGKKMRKKGTLCSKCAKDGGDSGDGGETSNPWSSKDYRCPKCGKKVKHKNALCSECKAKPGIPKKIIIAFSAAAVGLLLLLFIIHKSSNQIKNPEPTAEPTPLPTSVPTATPAPKELKYSIIDNTITITGCEKTTVNLDIPSKIEGYPVKRIGLFAFDQCSFLTNVTIPDSVISIEKQAFYLCVNLKSVTIPKSVKTIGQSAFYSCIGLSDVYYTGTSSQFGEISTETSAWEGVAATVHCTDGDIKINSGVPEALSSEATDSTVFWPLQERLEAEIYPKVSAGWVHSLYLGEPCGKVTSTGSNEYRAYNLSNWTDIVDIADGTLHALGLKADGTVVAAGYNDCGQCDVSFSNINGIIAIDAGKKHSVMLRNDGTVIARGDNIQGQCNIDGWENIIAISAGDAHTVGLKADGTVVAVGYNIDGECNVENWSNIAAVSGGSNHTVGLKKDGTVVAVGSNKYGQCDVMNWTEIVAISAGEKHTLGLKSDGTVVAYGSNEYGQCNVGTWSDIVSISAGSRHSIGGHPNGKIETVGSNANNQLDMFP